MSQKNLGKVQKNPLIYSCNKLNSILSNEPFQIPQFLLLCQTLKNFKTIETMGGVLFGTITKARGLKWCISHLKIKGLIYHEKTIAFMAFGELVASGIFSNQTWVYLPSLVLSLKSDRSLNCRCIKIWEMLYLQYFYNKL